MSRLNSLAITTSVRSSKPAFFQVENELGDGAIDLPFHAGQRGMAVFVCVPVQERHVFGRHLDEAGPGFGQPAGQQTAESESARVVACP